MKRCYTCGFSIKEHEEYRTEPDASGNNDRTYWHTPKCPRKYLRKNVIEKITGMEAILVSEYQKLAKLG